MKTVSTSSSLELLSMERLPPTREALKQHIKRAVYQSSGIWANSLENQIQSLDPEEWGWQLNNVGSLNPLWSTKTSASQDLHLQTKCKCKKLCNSMRCSCKKNKVVCSLMCECDGKCKNDL